ncbi:MAG: T9SS type A sorting domain-containing protein [Bacteroidota bacterium]
MKFFNQIMLLCAMVLLYNSSHAQCTPDNNMPKGSILPEALDIAYYNTNYSQVMYYRAPTDTSAQTPFGTLPVQIDSMEITGVSGLPAGLSYVCNTGSCRFKGGESGCLTLSGSPTVKGVFPLVVYIRTYATIKGIVDIPATQNDSNIRYTVYVYGSVGLDDKTTSAELKIYPNPAKQVINIESNDKVEEVNIFDANGKLVQTQQQITGSQIQLNQLNKGLYWIKIQAASNTHVQKFFVE